jgi:hypothetical protein
LKADTKIRLCVFLVSLFFIISKISFSQRTNEENRFTERGRKIAAAATPIAGKIYKRIESRSKTVQRVERSIGEAIPLIQKAAPIVKQGFRIGKKIFKILSKLLR